LREKIFQTRTGKARGKKKEVGQGTTTIETGLEGKVSLSSKKTAFFRSMPSKGSFRERRRNRGGEKKGACTSAKPERRFFREMNDVGGRGKKR